jgi:hypothetical protein
LTKRKKRKKKRKLILQPPETKPKGNGINARITADDILDVAGAGYIDEDMHRSFMP